MIIDSNIEFRILKHESHKVSQAIRKKKGQAPVPLACVLLGMPRFSLFGIIAAMKGYYTYREPGEGANGLSCATRAKRIAVVTQGVKLPGEVRGYTRFRIIAEVLAEAGFAVDLITSSFQHWDKAQRHTLARCYEGHPYRIRFIHEPGYKRNLDMARIKSHAQLAKRLRAFLESEFEENPPGYDLIYSEIPPNDMALACAEVAQCHGIPYVADVNDLWPEAMRMAMNIPIASDIAFAPFARDAKRTYSLISAAVGTSDEYAARPGSDRDEPFEHITVYVGNDIAAFDAGARAHADEIVKPDDEIWVIYTGTIGASYDIRTLIDAAKLCETEDARIRVKILGDGPDRASLEAYADSIAAPVDFLGYTPYDLMAAYLCASDITVNSLVAKAPQSIVTKIGDYLAAGIPLINTGSSPEFRAKVEHDGFGVNVEAEHADILAAAILSIAHDPEASKAMGRRARAIAEQQFDQRTSYQAIVDLVRRLTDPAKENA